MMIKVAGCVCVCVSFVAIQLGRDNGDKCDLWGLSRGLRSFNGSTKF